MEPTVTPDASAPPDLGTMSPEAARAEIDATRTADRLHPWHDPGHRGHAAATERMHQLYQRAHGTGPAGDGPPAVPGLVAPPRPDTPAEPGLGDTVPDRPAMPDPYAPPATAAELDVLPVNTDDAPDFYDVAKAQAQHVIAEREGVADLVLEGRAVVRRVAQGPRMAPDAAERELHARWGSAYDAKLEAAHRAMDELLTPSDLAELEAADLDLQPDVADYFAKVGERMVDMNTPHGFNRIKARNLAALAAEAQKAGGRG